MAETADDRWTTTIHLAYINGDLSSATVVEGTVSDVARRTMMRHHPDAKLVSRTYPLGESVWPTRLVYNADVTLDDGYVGHWRHEFRRADEPWPIVDPSELTDVAVPS